jgi:nanoRNase/pAp phosphatase (c-di-AMP/oligoRNAs hydrolase)
MHPSGGGHAKAAGVVLTLSLAEVQALLPVQLAEAVAQARISAV